jgi:hypothetical protein
MRMLEHTARIYRVAPEQDCAKVVVPLLLFYPLPHYQMPCLKRGIASGLADRKDGTET